MAPIRHPKITGYDVKYSWNFKVRSQHFLKWVFLINNDIKYEYKEGINQWWQGQGCFICYFLWGMTTHGSNSRSNDIKTTALPLSKTFNLPASAITVSGVCQYWTYYVHTITFRILWILSLLLFCFWYHHNSSLLDTQHIFISTLHDYTPIYLLMEYSLHHLSIS